MSLVYTGVAYIIGLIYETVLNPEFDYWFGAPALTRALVQGKPETATVSTTMVAEIDAVSVAHQCISIFHEAAVREKSSEFDHVTRIHAEAKMFFFWRGCF